MLLFKICPNKISKAYMHVFLLSELISNLDVSRAHGVDDSSDELESDPGGGVLGDPPQAESHHKLCILYLDIGTITIEIAPHPLQYQYIKL